VPPPSPISASPRTSRRSVERAHTAAGSGALSQVGKQQLRPAAARYNERTGSWATAVIKDLWLPVPPGAMAPIALPDGHYHVGEYAGMIRCFFQPGRPSA
jgi:hypothetical protein